MFISGEYYIEQIVWRMYGQRLNEQGLPLSGGDII